VRADEELFGADPRRFDLENDGKRANVNRNRNKK